MESDQEAALNLGNRMAKSVKRPRVSSGTRTVSPATSQPKIGRPEVFIAAALHLNPNNAEAHNNLGLTLLVIGRARASIPEFETALRLKPTLEIAGKNLRRAQAKLESQR